MLRKPFEKFRRHISLVVIAAGAACFFLANVVLKEVLDEASYGYYSLLITFLSLIYMYGMLGLEQVFLRFSHRKEQNHIETQLFQVNLISVVMTGSSILAAILFYVQFPEITDFLNPALFWCSTFAAVSLLFFFNVFRLNEEYAFAQLLSNLWKIALFIIAFVYLFVGGHSITTILTLIQVSLLLSTVVAFAVFRNRIQFSFVKTPAPSVISKMAVHFFIAITCFSAVMFGDRFIVEHKFGIVILGDYFYLSNLFIAPFSILQNYVGFKQLVFYKNHFEEKVYRKLNIRILKLGIALSCSLLVIPMGNYYFGLLDFDFKPYWMTIFLLLLTGIARLYSASINAAFEATTDLKTLEKVNLSFFVLCATVFVIAYFLLDNLDAIVAILLMVWVIRSRVQNHFLLRTFTRKE